MIILCTKITVLQNFKSKKKKKIQVMKCSKITILTSLNFGNDNLVYISFEI